MKKYFLGLFCLLIIASSLFVGVNKVSALTSVNSVTATIVDTPTLRLSYDNSSSRSKNESLLTANFKVRVKTGNVDSKVYLNFANVELVNKTGVSNQYTNTKTIVITSSLGLYKENTDQYGRKYIIVPANSEVDFKVETTRKPSELFAGSYTASLLNLVNYDDSFEYGTQQIKVSENKTNSVIIVGEKSPYIESVTSTQIKCLNCDSTITIKGVRMNNSKIATSSYLYGQISNWSVSSDGKTITFKTKIVGSYDIKLSDSKTGLSNNVNIKIDSIVFEPSVTITSPRKGTTVGNTFKVSGTCKNYEGNVSVYYYSTQKVSVDAKCLSGKWSTDINLYTNALSGTFDLFASLSTGQQVVLEIPFKIKQITTAEPSITISDASGNQGLTVNIGDKFTISGTPKNLKGLQYWFGSSLPYGNYFSRAYFFDSILFKDSCSNNEASKDGIWSITCTAKTSGVGKFYIEIYKDGKTYRSNDVVVTVEKTSNQPLITSINPTSVYNTTDQVLSIYGKGFNSNSRINFIQDGRSMGGVFGPSIEVLNGGNQINILSPSLIFANLSPGVYGVVVSNNGFFSSIGKSNSVNITVTSDSMDSIRVISPNGGETFKIGEMFKLSYKIPSNKSYSVSYYLVPQPGTTIRQGDGTYFDQISGGYSLGGSQRYTPVSQDSSSIYMPSDILPGLYKIRTYLRNSGDNSGSPSPTTAIAYDDSDSYFNIFSSAEITNCTYTYGTWGTCINGTQTRTYISTTRGCTGTPVVLQSCTNSDQPSITVISPNGGETFKTRGILNIKWNSEQINFSEKVKIEISYEHNDPTYAAGNYFQDWIIEETLNDGSYSWTIPEYYANGLNTSSFVIKVTSAGVSDYSDETFKIIPGYTANDFLVRSPSRGMIYSYGDQMNISWISNSDDSYMSSLLKKNDPSFLRLSLNTKGTPPNLTWNIPSDIPEGDDYFIKVDEGRSKTGYSGLFSIKKNINQTLCSYTYGDWGPCINGTQTRTHSTISSRCETPTTPVVSQTCTVTPPVVEDDIYCGSKTQSPLPAGCGSKKAQVTQAKVVLSNNDVIEVIKIGNFYNSGAKWGASIVTCPANTNYRVCVENGNDGAANYILLGVKSAPLNYNSSRTTAAALEAMKIEDIIQILRLLK